MKIGFLINATNYQNSLGFEKEVFGASNCPFPFGKTGLAQVAKTIGIATSNFPFLIFFLSLFNLHPTHFDPHHQATRPRRSQRIQRLSGGGKATPITTSPAPSAPSSSSTFTPFHRLPLEIRQMIWKFTLEPRVVEMEFSENLGFYTVCKVPTALKVSQESRDTVKKPYVECFSSLWYPRGTLFNSAMDTLYLSRDFFDHVPAFFHTFREKETAGIRYIAIDEDDFETGFNCESCGLSLTGPNKSKRFRNALKD
ncbi:hypothetical protein DL95DRAFT_450972 [Leptodontidium sp. 2 PMI_412]|nr:hypothetical protein DL95DRAFT_450972 [Leptodontidium sp. 2 PMI_412]